MIPLVIYHGNCADGFGAAWVFSHHFGSDACDFHPGIYQDAPPDVSGRDVFLVDFSYKRAVVEQIVERARHVMLIDHHKTALDDLKPLMDSRAISHHCSLDHSGAVLAWQYTRFGPPPRMLLHIEDRDLWRFALPFTREIQACIFSHPYDFALWDRLMLATDRDIENFIREGTAIERKHHKDIAELVGVCTRRMVIGGHDIPVANMPYTLTSDAGHLLAQQEPFAACYWDTPEGRVFSLRSRDDGLDVSEIAKAYGGGGHRNAAGFRVPYGHPLAS